MPLCFGSKGKQKDDHKKFLEKSSKTPEEIESLVEIKSSEIGVKKKSQNPRKDSQNDSQETSHTKDIPKKRKLFETRKRVEIPKKEENIQDLSHLQQFEGQKVSSSKKQKDELVQIPQKTSKEEIRKQEKKGKSTSCFGKKSTPEEKEKKIIEKQKKINERKEKRMKKKERKIKKSEEKKRQSIDKKANKKKRIEERKENTREGRVPVGEISEDISKQDVTFQKTDDCQVDISDRMKDMNKKKEKRKKEKSEKNVKKEKKISCLNRSKKTKLQSNKSTEEDITLLSVHTNKNEIEPIAGKKEGITQTDIFILPSTDGKETRNVELQIVPGHDKTYAECVQSKNYDQADNYDSVNHICKRNISPGSDSLEYKRKEYFRDFFLVSRSLQCGCGNLFHQTDQEKYTVAMSAALESIVERLEKIASRLESTTALAKIRDEESGEVSNSQWLMDYDKLIDTTVQNYSKISQSISDEVKEQSEMVLQAFKIQYGFLELASKNKKPDDQSLLTLLSPLSEVMQKIQSFKELHRKSEYFNHLSAVSESMSALGWITMCPAPASLIKDMIEAARFYTNRVLKDWKNKNNIHAEWVTSWLNVLSELHTYVKVHHTTGLSWNPRGKNLNEKLLPSPPPPPSISNMTFHLPDTAALFAEINKGEEVTKALRHVTDDMKLSKSASKTESVGSLEKSNIKQVITNYPPAFYLDGKKWIVEYQKNVDALTISNTEMNQSVYIYCCQDSTVQIKGKVNSVALDSCKKTSLLLDSVVSCVELVNCHNSQIQVLGKLPTISIDKSDGVQLYLSKEAFDAEVITAKSSAVNVLIPTDDGEFREQPIPEQFKTTILGNGITTTVCDLSI